MHDFLKPVSKFELLHAESSRIEEIRTAAGVDTKVFGGYYVPMLSRYAEYVQRLPLAPTVFASAGGALQYGLITAMVAVRYSNQMVFFPEHGSERNRMLRPQTCFAAFVASLATGVALLAENARIYQKQEEEDWEYHPLVSRLDLRAWLIKYPDPVFEWRTGAAPLSSAVCAGIAARFIEPGLLSAFDLEVISMIFSAIRPDAAQSGIETTLARVIRQSSATVLDHYENEYRKTYSDPGIHLKSSGQTCPGDFADRLVDTLNRHSSSMTETAPARPSAPSQLASTAAEELMAAAAPPLKEWIAELRESKDFDAFTEKLEFGEDGILVPLPAFAGFGLKAPDTINFMRAAGWLIGRKDGQQLLHPALAPYFRRESNAQL